MLLTRVVLFEDCRLRKTQSSFELASKWDGFFRNNLVFVLVWLLVFGKETSYLLWNKPH